MTIGVLDSDGRFSNEFFYGKKLKVIRKKNYGFGDATDEFTHGEYVCAHIFKENPDAEIILVPIINKDMKCSVRDMIDGIELLIDYRVDMINLSIGDEYKYHQELELICRKAADEGILIVAAHSNREVTATYPAEFPFVVGISCIDKKKPVRIIQYDEAKNRVSLSTSFFSLYHLGIPQLLPGNSFACAKITGILSHHKEEYRTFLKGFEHNKLNLHYPYFLLRKKKCLIATNRKEETLQQLFVQEVLNAKKCLTFQEVIDKDILDSNKYEVLFIDHNCYKEAIQYRLVIARYAVQMPNMELVLRYPLFNMEERLKLYKNKKAIIHQFFI